MSPRFHRRTWPLLSRIALAALAPLFALVMAVAPLLSPTPGRAQVSISLGVDAVTDGNTAISLGSIQDCVEVQVGDLLAADVYVRDVQGLIAWELAVGFDPAILEITSHNNRLFLASASFDASEPVPDSDGEHFMAVATLGSSRSGSGVLARVTFRANAPGRSPATIVSLDVNGDGKVDYGPRLNPGARPLGDSDGDGIFDGSVSQAEVAVGQACNSPDPTSTPTPTPRPEDTPPPSGAHGGGGTDTPPPSVLLTDSPPRGSGTDTPPVSVLLADSPPRGPSGEQLTLAWQGGEGTDDASGGDEPPPGRVGAETPEGPLPHVGEPPAGLTDGGLPTDADAPQPPGGGSSSIPFWLVASIAGILLVAGAGGMLMIVRSLRQPWRG